MISPRMFDEFCLPELISTAGKLYKPFYHLDGPGELRHLDSLLVPGEIAGIQWAMGAGEPERMDWRETYRKIGRAGRKMQVVDYRYDDKLRGIVKAVDPGLIQMQTIGFRMDRKDEAVRFLAEYGI